MIKIEHFCETSRQTDRKNYSVRPGGKTVKDQVYSLYPPPPPVALFVNKGHRAPASLFIRSPVYIFQPIAIDLNDATIEP